MHLTQFIVALLLSGAAVAIVSMVVPGFEVKGGFRAALVVALVYGVLKVLLQRALIILTLPAVILTLGAFIFVINAFLLWLTDKLVKRFEVKSIGALLVGSFLLSAVDLGFQILLRHHTFF